MSKYNSTTSDPTIEPTYDPTLDPTNDPTIVPTIETNYNATSSQQVINFGITTDIENAGDATITLTLNWNQAQYTCILSSSPFSPSTYYSCNGSTKSSITPNPHIDYFMKIEYNSTNPLQISMINVTDNTGSYYAIDSFCIG